MAEHPAPSGAAPVGAGPAPARPVVLALFAHPDDETLTAGGLLAVLARRAEVHIVTATRGELGEQVGPEGERTTPDRARLPHIRIAEVRAACAALGVAGHEFLDGGTGAYTDSGMVWADEKRSRAIPDPDGPVNAFSRIDIDGPAQRFAERILELKPLLVVTEEPAGGYGHPDHVRCHEVVMRAVEIAAPTYRVPLVAYAVMDARLVRAANTEIRVDPDLPTTDTYGLALNPPPAKGPMRSGVTRDVDVIVDTSNATHRVATAIRAHQTQVHMVHERPEPAAGAASAGWYALTDNDLKPILTHAGLVLAPGWGTPAGLKYLLGKLGVAERQPRSMGEGSYSAFILAFAVISGLVVGVAGSFAHRAIPPWGLIISLVVVLAGAIMNRSMGDKRTGLFYGAGVTASLLAVTLWRPVNDIVIGEDLLGYGWLAGAFGALIGGLVAGEFLARPHAETTAPADTDEPCAPAPAEQVPGRP